MTDLSKYTLAELEAEIERRKAEPDWAAWEPKWQAFHDAMGWKEFSIGKERKREYIRALIAAHNTPLAGEVDPDEGWTKYKLTNGVGPRGVSLETHDIQAYDVNADKWVDLLNGPLWETFRYRPKQTDEVRP